MDDEKKSYRVLKIFPIRILSPFAVVLFAAKSF